MEEGTNALPPKIASAIANVMAAVPKLAKGERNTHGNYNFASVDAFLEAVRPLCAREGLLIIQDETDLQIIEGSYKDRDGVERTEAQWLRIRYVFTLAHVSGETWEYRPARSVMVHAKMGAQSFGAAQSYVQKQFLRSLFQIATGEEEVDHHPQETLPSSGGKRNREQPPARQERPAPQAREPGAWRPVSDEARREADLSNVDKDGFPVWFKEPVSVTKKAKANGWRWGDMIAGEDGGERHEILGWLASSYDPTKRMDGSVKDARYVRKDEIVVARAQACLQWLKDEMPLSADTVTREIEAMTGPESPRPIVDEELPWA